jgi:curli biogenesis system outer membrane secretion channel CsgG
MKRVAKLWLSSTVLLLIGATFTTVAFAQAAPDKKRVAVDPFDYSTVKTTVAAIFGTDQDIGRGIQAMLVKRIAEDGKMVVVERGKLQKIEGEQDLNASNRVQKGTGAKIGKIRGADALLYGDIVTFGRDDNKKSIKGGGLIGGVIGGIANSKAESKAVVVVDYRLVDAETSEVIATGEARGESSRKSNGVGGFLGGFAGAAGMSVDMTSSNFGQTIIGEATMDCVNKLAAFLNDQVPKLETKKVDVEGLVAYVNGSSVTLNKGSDDGVVAGDKFDVNRILNEVRDPTTHEVIDLATQKIGEMVITTVKPRVAIGTFSGSGTPKIGDDAKKQ